MVGSGAARNPRWPAPTLLSRQRRRKVELLAIGRAQHQNAERAPDRVDLTKRRQHCGQALDIQPIDLDIKILRRVAQQNVAHRAANDQRQPAYGLDRVEHGL